MPTKLNIYLAYNFAAVDRVIGPCVGAMKDELKLVWSVYREIEIYVWVYLHGLCQAVPTFGL